MPLHITQRGVDRGKTFVIAEDYAFYRWALREAAAESECSLHSYGLMTNHTHVLLTPADVDSPTRLMQSLGRRYVRYFNDRYRRTGPLWEGRFRSTIVDTTAYFFASSRYIELNPVRANLVNDPAKYEWSSFRCNALGHADPLVTPHREYEALGRDRAARLKAYRALFAAELDARELAGIRAELRGRPRLHPSPYRQIVAASTAVRFADVTR